MPARASKTSTNASFGPYGAAEGYSHDELRPGERISPLPHRKSRALLRGAFLLAIFGGGWALLTDRVPWPDWQTLGATASWMSRIAPSCTSSNIALTTRVMRRSPAVCQASAPALAGGRETMWSGGRIDTEIATPR